jgi:minor extracellular serine protease Vpr
VDVEKFLPRNSTPTAFFGISWDGTVIRRNGTIVGPIPNGTYRVDLSVLKALGDRDNPAHVERWTSPEITIARP